jgi:hypothetical protein
MSDADDRAYKWLVARERGDDIGHVLAEERAPYEQLGALLGKAIAPPAGFRQRVLARIDAEERARNPQPISAPEAAPPRELASEPAPEPAPEAAPPRPPAEKKPPEPPKPASDGKPVLVLTLGGPPGQETEPAAPPSRWKRRLGLAVGFAAAAAAVYFLWIRQAPRAPEVLALATDIRAGSAVMRGEQASLGDTFLAHAETIGPGALRVYGGTAEKMLAQCSDERGGRGGCTVERDGARRVYRLELKLERPGYTSAAVFAGPAIPPASGSRDQDLEAAAAARIPHREDKRINVR